MIGEITNHLWQSTVFAFAVALVAIAFRKNRAEVRYWLWLSASLKFLIPFSLLIAVGIRMWDALAAGRIATHVVVPAISQAMVNITQPFPETSAQISSVSHQTSWISVAILGLWTFGFFCVALMRCRSWFHVRADVRASTPINIAAAIPVRSSANLMEPGVVGFLHPVLLLPEGILKQLTPPQLDAVLAHEECHVRRRDNITSALHMIVEAIFWFHPAVWWIGAKLVEERERACDEAVLKLGNEPEVYAEGILNVCKSYLESPLRCVSGITGADLKKRIRAILTERVAGDLNFAKKAALAAIATAALALPIFVGAIGATSIRAQAQAAAEAGPDFKYEVASIKPSKPGAEGTQLNNLPDGFNGVNVNVMTLIQSAFGIFNDKDRIAGATGWLSSERFDVDAKMDASQAAEFQKLTPEKAALVRRHMLQGLLADRFKLAIHRESKDLPIYVLVVAKGGPKLQESKPADPNGNGIVSTGGRGPVGSMRLTGRGGPLIAQAVPMSGFAQALSLHLGRTVLDKTGLTAKYDFTLQWNPDDVAIPPSGGAPNDQPASPPSDQFGASFFTAIQEQLGLKLESQKGPVEVIVIDHVERPSGN